MSVRAKFSVYSKKEIVGGTEVEMTPVIEMNNPNSENHYFWKATPNGRITMFITNMDAVDTFQVGKPYYVDFTPAD